MSEALEFEVLTIFPGAIEAFVATGIMAKAIERELVVVRCTDLRTFTHDRHRTVDDAPFGGGAGMVIKPEPVAAALEAVTNERGPVHTILLTPSGPRFDQRAAERLARKPRIALLCGRYEGIDDRIREHFVDECLSIGDFVLNGGEVAAAVIIEAVGRLREGVLGNPESITTESFAMEQPGPTSEESEESDTWQPGLVLEHPHYTRPAKFREFEVPPVLLSGDHEAIERWRREVACLRTWALRPELRPRWRLPEGHPIAIAVAATASSDRAELERLAASVGAELVRIGGSRAPGSNRHPRDMRDLKQLRRQMRKRHGRDPWLLGVGSATADTGQLGPRVVLDTLAYVANQGPPPLILWFPADLENDAQALPAAIDAWLALDLESDRRFGRRLAIPSALIDISQPRAAPGSVAPLVRTALEVMRAEGLLPAAPGRAPSSDREISP